MSHGNSPVGASVRITEARIQGLARVLMRGYDASCRGFICNGKRVPGRAMENACPVEARGDLTGMIRDRDQPGAALASPIAKRFNGQPPLIHRVSVPWRCPRHSSGFDRDEKNWR